MTSTDDPGRARSDETRLAAQPLDAEDEALLASLRGAWDETDPVPGDLADRIRFALTLDALHAEVATLTQLDLAGSGARAGATEDVRSVTFTAESLITMVTLTQQPDGTVRIDGWTALADDERTAGPIRVEVLMSDATLQTTTDEDGRFAFESVPSGLARFALHEGEHTVLSPAIEL